MSHNDERGAIAVWASIALLAFIIAIGIGVDFAGQVKTEQQLRTVAREAARQGAQEATIIFDRPRLDASQAVAAATQHFTAAGHQGTARMVGTTNIEVTLTAEHPCAFLSIIGIHTLPAKATARADLEQVYRGQSG